MNKKRVVIAGVGFAGVFTVRYLSRHAPVSILVNIVAKWRHDLAGYRILADEPQV